MISTLAPLVMASWASASSVASLPCAFTTEYCEGERPGASNSVYRAEVTVSGRMTATLPLPSAASGLSAVIAEKVRFRSVTLIEGTAADVPELAVLAAVGEELLLQAAAARHTASGTAATAPFLATLIMETTSRLFPNGRVQAGTGMAIASPTWRISAGLRGHGVFATTIGRRKLTWP